MNERRNRRQELDDEEEDDVPVRKQKKKKKKPQPSPWPMVGRIAVIFMGALCGPIGLVVRFWASRTVGGGPPAEAVAKWDRFSTQGNEFAFDHPAGWKVSDHGLPGKRGVDITSRAAKISINENMAGSLVGDIGKAFAGGREVDEDREPVAVVHEMGAQG